MAVFLPTWIASAKLKLSAIITLGTVGAVGGCSMIAAEHSKSIVSTQIAKTNIAQEIKQAYASVTKSLPIISGDQIASYALTARSHILEVPKHITKLSQTAIQHALKARKAVISHVFPALKEGLNQASLFATNKITTANASWLVTQFSALLDKLVYAKAWIKQTVQITIPSWYNKAKNWFTRNWAGFKNIGSSIFGAIKPHFTSTDKWAQLPTQLVSLGKQIGQAAPALWNFLKNTNIKDWPSVLKTLIKKAKDPNFANYTSAINSLLQSKNGIFAGMDETAKAALMSQLGSDPNKALEIIKTMNAINGIFTGTGDAGGGGSGSTGASGTGAGSTTQILKLTKALGITDAKDLSFTSKDIQHIFSKSSSAEQMRALHVALSIKAAGAAAKKGITSLFSWFGEGS